MKFSDGRPYDKFKVSRSESTSSDGNSDEYVPSTGEHEPQMRELQLVTRPAGRSNRIANRLVRRLDLGARSGVPLVQQEQEQQQQQQQPEGISTQTLHPRDALAHWAIKDGDEYHELVRGDDGKAQFSRRKWTADEEREIKGRSTFTWTDRPRGDLEVIGRKVIGEMNREGSYHASEHNCQDFVDRVDRQYSSPQLRGLLRERENTRAAFDRFSGGSRTGNALLRAAARATHTLS